MKKILCIISATALALLVAYVVATTVNHQILPILVSISAKISLVNWWAIIAIAVLVPVFLALLARLTCTTIRDCKRILRDR